MGHLRRINVPWKSCSVQYTIKVNAIFNISFFVQLEMHHILLDQGAKSLLYLERIKIIFPICDFKLAPARAGIK